jgi:hypothetical protein
MFAYLCLNIVVCTAVVTAEYINKSPVPMLYQYRPAVC